MVERWRIYSDHSPFPEYSAAPPDTNIRKSLPTPGPAPAAKFPELQKATLSNGVKIILAERSSIPVVNFNVLFDAGYASDQFAAMGTANLAMNMLDEGTKTRTSLQLSEELAQLGANLGTGSSLDVSSVTLSALKSNLDPSLNLLADIILNPSFPKEDFDRLQKQTIAGIQREKAQPVQMGLRVLPQFLYGKGHAYASPFTGTGTEESVAKLTVADMIKFHDTWIKPNNATIIVVGDIKLAELQPKIEKLFAAWKPGDVPKKNIAAVEQPSKPIVYIMDKPGSMQSIIFAAQLAPLKSSPDDIALDAMNTILGGAFTSRINMNIREDKHWSYGAGSFIAGARAQRPFIAYAPVQTDKTKESMIEVKRELTDIIGQRPATQDELHEDSKQYGSPASRRMGNHGCSQRFYFSHGKLQSSGRLLQYVCGKNPESQSWRHLECCQTCAPAGQTYMGCRRRQAKNRSRNKGIEFRRDEISRCERECDTIIFSR